MKTLCSFLEDGSCLEVRGTQSASSVCAPPPPHRSAFASMYVLADVQGTPV